MSRTTEMAPSPEVHETISRGVTGSSGSLLGESLQPLRRGPGPGPGARGSPGTGAEQRAPCRSGPAPSPEPDWCQEKGEGGREMKGEPETGNPV